MLLDPLEEQCHMSAYLAGYLDLKIGWAQMLRIFLAAGKQRVRLGTSDEADVCLMQRSKSYEDQIHLLLIKLYTPSLDFVHAAHNGYLVVVLHLAQNFAPLFDVGNRQAYIGRSNFFYKL